MNTGPLVPAARRGSFPPARAPQVTLDFEAGWRAVSALLGLTPSRRAARRPTGPAGLLYLVFNEGYSTVAGDDWMRPALCIEAPRFGWVTFGNR